MPKKNTIQLSPTPLFTWHLPEHQRAGIWGEKVAAKYLKRNGYRLIGKRVRVGPKDEIDIVARENNILVIVEVKTRKSRDFGNPADAVDKDKIFHLSRAAVRFLREYKGRPDAIRFDIIEVIGTRKETKPEIHHLVNAFPAHHNFTLRW